MENIKKTFGERVKQRRELLGMSQDELAQKCGYTSRSSIAKIETGHVDLPGTKKLALFAAALKTTTSYLVSGISEDEISWVKISPIQNSDADDETMRYAEELRRSPGMRMMFDAAKGCTEEDMRRVAAMIKAYKGADDNG